MRCPRCGGWMGIDTAETGYLRGQVWACIACGPQYGRHAPTEEDIASLRPTPNFRHRYRGPSRGGQRL